MDIIRRHKNRKRKKPIEPVNPYVAKVNAEKNYRQIMQIYYFMALKGVLPSQLDKEPSKLFLEVLQANSKEVGELKFIDEI